jgi:hypothetical protein
MRAKMLHRVQQRLQPFEAIVHGREKANRFLRHDVPALAPFLAPTQTIVLGEAVRIDGAAHDVKLARSDVVIAQEMLAHHGTVDDDQRRLHAKVLLPFEQRKGPVGEVEPFDGVGQAAPHRAGMLAAIVVDRGGVQASLRIKNVLSPGLVEADGDIVLLSRERVQAALAEAPWPQEARAGGGGKRMDFDTGERAFVPAAGVQMHFMPIAQEPPRQVADIGLAAPARGQDAFVTKCDVHREISFAFFNLHRGYAADSGPP